MSKNGSDVRKTQGGKQSACSAYQFMVGAEFMVAPVLDCGEDTVEVYLPRGRWVHLWTGEEYGSLEGGVYEAVRAPLGVPAVFYKEDSEAGRKSRDGLTRQGLM